MNYLDKLSMENGLHLERNANKSAFISSDRHQAKQAISVLGSMIKQYCRQITRADQTAHPPRPCHGTCTSGWRPHQGPPRLAPPAISNDRDPKTRARPDLNRENMGRKRKVAPYRREELEGTGGGGAAP